jgi:hypothetical protein
MGEWRYSSTVLSLDTRWWWVVNVTPRSLYNMRQRRRYPVNRRLNDTQSRSGRCEKDKNVLAISTTKLRPQDIAAKRSNVQTHLLQGLEASTSKQTRAHLNRRKIMRKSALLVNRVVIHNFLTSTLEVSFSNISSNTGYAKRFLPVPPRKLPIQYLHQTITCQKK